MAVTGQARQRVLLAVKGRFWEGIFRREKEKQ